MPELSPDADVSRIARALGVSPSWCPAPELAHAGLALFLARHPALAPCSASLLSLGSLLWPLDAPDRDEAEPTPGWSARSIADHLEQRLARAAHARRRARWLTLLMESSVSWVCGPRRRVLVLAGGEVIRRGWTSLDALPPLPPGSLRSQDERRARFDRDRRDRLRVLTTELRRLEVQGAAPAVRTGPAAVVRGEALRRLLARV